MKKKKVRETLKNLNTLFSRVERKKKVKLKQVKKVIEDLQKREATIKKHLEKEASKSKLKQLASELDVIHAQHKKGQVLLKQLLEEKNKRKRKN